MQLLWLNAKDVTGLLTMGQAIDAVDEAFVQFARGEAHMPCKVYLDVPQGDFRAMPASLPGSAGIKWINVHPGNPTLPRPLPSVIGTYLLSDPTNGALLAVMDATVITRLRTAAAAAVATRALARPGAATLGVIGCGAQAGPHIEALRQVISFESILLADARPALATALAAQFPGARVAPLEEVCGADVLVTLTSSRTPVVKRAWVRPGAHINAMGADAPGKQELDPELLRAARVYFDDWEQASHSGEINVPLTAGLLRMGEPPLAGSLPKVMAGQIAGRRDAEEITVFDSTGLAIQDLALARLAYAEALERGIGVKLDNPLP